VSPLVVDVPPARPSARRRADDRIPPPWPPVEGGGDDGREPSPRRPRLDNTRLAMLFFLSAETMFFAGLISAFFVLRLAAPMWPPPLQPRLPVLVTGFNTLVLLASSAAMVAALRAMRRADGRRLVERLAATAALGALFLAVQGFEWARLIHYGLTVTSGAYGATFYTLIGIHAAHVLGALVWLGVTLMLAARGRFVDGRVSGLRACATYWHYVVGLWPILYVTVYLV
jgi:heme/copper-type cytochrome/quinol oxidase subunit 3